MFSSIQSTFAEGQKSWNTFVKAINEGPSTAYKNPEKAKAPNENNQAIHKDEHVDRFGYLHTKVTVTTFDDEGNEIGSETRITIRPADKQPEASTSGSALEGITDGQDGGKSGWFWK